MLSRLRLLLQNSFWLLPPLLAALPHVSHLPAWLSAGCAGLWLWRLVLLLGRRPLPPQWLRILLALAALAVVTLLIGPFIGRQGGVPLLILLMFVKLLETDSPRQQRVVVLLSFFVALSQFLFSQFLAMAVYLLAVAWIATAALVRLQPLPQAGLGHSLRASAGLLLAGLPLALALFLFFPRLDRPLWLLPALEQTARTGLSDSMRPGDFGRLILSGEIALRADFAAAPPDTRQMYWRGPVLTEFDGRTWRAMANLADLRAPVEAVASPLRYTLTLEPHERRWVFTLGLPVALPEGTHLKSGMQLMADRPVERRQRFALTTHPRYRLGAEPQELDQSLRLPEGYNPRSRELAARWRSDTPDPRQRMQRALDLYRDGFTYTLAPPSLGLHSVDEFLFDSRRGFCEHYAGSFVFLMRAAGVPARVVTGYQGGEVNPIDGHVVVRQFDAHAWAEVWLEGEGWLRVDPTASVSPLRIEQGLAAALPAAELPPGLIRLGNAWLRHLHHGWEAVNNGWNQWVLGYGLERQLQLLAAIRPELAERAWLAAVVALLLGMLALAVYTWRMARPAGTDRAARLYARFATRLSRLGLRREPAEGPLEFALRASRERPDLEGEIMRISRLYIEARYAGEETAQAALAVALRGFRPRRRRRDRHVLTCGVEKN